MGSRTLVNKCTGKEKEINSPHDSVFHQTVIHIKPVNFSFSSSEHINTCLFIQSSLKTEFSTRGSSLGGNTHRTGGWFLSDSEASRA